MSWILAVWALKKVGDDCELVLLGVIVDGGAFVVEHIVVLADRVTFAG